jgi:hypothetical protein
LASYRINASNIRNILVCQGCIGKLTIVGNQASISQDVCSAIALCNSVIHYTVCNAASCAAGWSFGGNRASPDGSLHQLLRAQLSILQC